MIRIWRLTALVGMLQVCIPTVQSQDLKATDRPDTFKISVYLDRVPEGGVEFSAAPSDGELEVVSSQPIQPTRPWLLLVDPVGMSRDNLESRVDALASAMLSSGKAQHIRVGIPVLGGVLSKPIPFLGSSRKTIVGTTMSYIPETVKEQANLGRTLDLLAALIRQAEEKDGALHCLVLARDREIEGDDADYLKYAAERLFLVRTGTLGTTLFAYLEGDKALARICRTAGGLDFQLRQSPASVMQRISQTLQRGYQLDLELVSGDDSLLRRRLDLRARDAGGVLLELRTPRAVWCGTDNRPAVDFYHMREAMGWIRRAAEDALAGDLATAQRRLANAVNEDPWNPKAHYLAGKVASDSGNLAQARHHLSRAIRLLPLSEPALLLYGQVMQRLGKAAEGLQRLHAMIRAGHPSSPAIQLQTARLLAALGSHAEALAIYQELAGSGRQDAQLRAEYGTQLWRMGRSDEAHRQIHSVLIDSPYNLTALICAAEIAEARGDLDEAASYGRRAVQIYPEKADAHTLAGRIQLARREWDEAIASYKTALQLSPESRDVLRALAAAQRSAGQLADSRETLLQVLEMNPSAIETYQEMARTYLAEGNLSNATSVLEQGAAQADGGAHILFREAAEIRERRGEYGQALLNYRAMLDSLPPERAAAAQRSLARHLQYLSARIDRRNESPQQPAQPLHRLEVPGGLATLARVLDVDASLLGEPDALERLFRQLLGLGWEERSRLQRRMDMFFRNYEALLHHLRRKQILPADFQPSKPLEFVFSLVGDKAVLKRTGDALGFFGIKMSSKRMSDGETLVTLTVHQGRKQSERRELLHQLGVSFPDPELSEIRFTVGSETLPVLIPSEKQSALLLPDRKDTSEWLLGDLVSDSKAMRLYIALASCSDEARSSLIRSVPAQELAGLTDIIFVFGRFLDFGEEGLRLPGSANSWERFLGVEQSPPDRFTTIFLNRDRGRALILYYVLKRAPRDMQQYFTATPERLRALYRLVPPIDAVRLGSGYQGIWKYDVRRILELCRIEDGDPFLPLNSRFATHLFGAEMPSAAGIEEDGGPMMLSHQRLTHLVELAYRSSPLSTLTMIDVLEFLMYLEETRPEMLTPESIASIMKQPSSAPVLLELIWDINPRPGSLVRYFEYCRRLVEAGERSWNVNRTRTSQALFFLLAALRREGILGEPEGRRLFETALSRLDEADDESTFARQVATFLEEELLPVLSQALDKPVDSDELLLRALAGWDPPRDFASGNLQLRFEAAEYRLARMRGTTQLQGSIPIHQMLKIYGMLEQIGKPAGRTADTAAALAAALEECEPILSGEKIPAEEQGAAAQMDMAGLKMEMSRLEQSGGSSNIKEAAAFADRAAASLHTELGITLLTLCYAYTGSPEIDALAFDPTLVRKHSFYGDIRISDAAWSRTSLKQREGVGTYLTGSLAGLDSQLSRLEWAESLISVRKNEGKELGAAMLSNLRKIRPQFRTDRAQEYVALSTALARELLSAAASEESIFRWISGELGRLMSPMRRNRVQRAIRQVGSPAPAMTPSELFLLGRSFVQSGYRKVPPAPSTADGQDSGEPVTQEATFSMDSSTRREAVTRLEFPSLNRLQRLIPEADTEDAAAFRRETDQYGVSLQHRFGLSQLSIHFLDPYEQLDHNAPSDLLLDRICDLKIRLAEIQHSLGLPAYLGEVLGEAALRSILPKSAPLQANTWREVLEKIADVGPGEVQAWIEELLHQGILTVTSKDGRSH